MNFSICFECQKLCVYNQHLPITAPQDNIPCEGECRPDQIPEEAVLNTVKNSNMSIDIGPVETDAERSRHRKITVDAGAGELVVHPLKCGSETMQRLG